VRRGNGGDSRRKGTGPPGDEDLFRSIETRSVRGSRAFTTLEIINVVTGVLVFFGAIFKVVWNDAVWAVLLVLWLCGLSAACIVLLFVHDRRVRRRIRYANAVVYLHRAQHVMRDASVSLDRGASADEIYRMLQSVLTSTAGMFTLVTGAQCRACIKQVHASGEKVTATDADALRSLEVSTLKRDEVTGDQASDSSRAFVDRNTDFELLFLHPEKHRWFFANDLEDYARTHSYRNSSWDGDAPRDYHSTCVWPIQKRDDTNQRNHDIVGFLCVDSLETNIFDERFDFDAGACVADSLYTLLTQMRRKLSPTAVTSDVPAQPALPAHVPGDSDE
jgi:hypothetical protein